MSALLGLGSALGGLAGLAAALRGLAEAARLALLLFTCEPVVALRLADRDRERVVFLVADFDVDRDLEREADLPFLGLFLPFEGDDYNEAKACHRTFR